MAPPITIVGHTTHDRFPDRTRPGGCAYYGAKTYRELGLEAGLVTGVGEDFACRAALEQLPVALCRRGSTTEFANLYPEDRPREQYVGSRAPSLAPGDVDPAWRSSTVLHLAPVLGELRLEPWLRWGDPDWRVVGAQGWLKQPGDRVSSAGGPVAEMEAPRTVIPRRWRVDEEELARVDVLFLSDEDLAGREALYERIRRRVPVVLRTHGAAGTTVSVDGQQKQIGTVDAEAVDPTGAGDTFAAAFTAALVRGRGPVAAAEFGAAAASVVVEGVGASSLHALGVRARRRCRRAFDST